MPKKFAAENSKAVAAKARKAAVKEDESAKKQKAKDDAYWQDDDKHAARKQQRKDEEEKKRQEALRRKQELKAAYEEDMSKAGHSKPKAAPAPKVTQHALNVRRDAERKAREEEEQRKKLEAQKIEVPVAAVEENLNRLDLDAHTARNVDDAIRALGSGGGGDDKHPEKRLRTAYNAFEEIRLPQLKAENPTLRLSQVKQMLFKEWQKCPDNPANQRALNMA